MPLTHDVAIIGAGPAGCTAGALLAAEGLSVCLIEQDAFPRFKIGESLLPAGNAILRRIGVWEQLDQAGFMRKYGGEFVSSDGSSRVHNVFSNGLIEGMDYTYQVERSRFDQLLLDNARARGCQVMQPVRVDDAQLRDGIWDIAVSGHTAAPARLQSRWLLDASGRRAFYGKSRRLARDNIPYPKRLAVYGHFRDVRHREHSANPGNIIVTRLRDGWFWSIPLDAEKTSVGVVSQRRRDEWISSQLTPARFFAREIRRSPFLTALLADAELIGDYRTTGDYAHSFQHYAFERALLLGDAAGFIDPVFSSGVYLAMHSAAMAADAVVLAHGQQRGLTPRECRRYTRTLKKNVRVMRDLIEVYYDDASFSVFMAPSDRLQLFSAVNSIVAGNTRPEFRLWWRFKLFLLICRANRWLPLAPQQRLT